MLLAEHMSLNEAGRILRMSRMALQNLVEYWVDKAVCESDMSAVTRLSIAETSFKRGRSHVTVIGDPERRRVIGVEDGVISKPSNVFPMTWNPVAVTVTPYERQVWTCPVPIRLLPRFVS